MKRLFLGALFLTLVSLPVAAQPEENEDVEAPRVAAAPKPARQGTPKEYLEADIKNFIQRLNRTSDWWSDSKYFVTNGRFGYFGTSEWAKWWNPQTAQPGGKLILGRIDVKNLTPDNKATVEVEYAHGGRDSNIETLFLQWNNADKLWRFEPQKPDDNQYTFNKPLTWAIYMIAQGPNALSTFYEASSKLNLAQCGLGTMQFLEDYDEKFAFTPELWQDAILPYVKSNQLYFQPDNKKPYSFNSFLSDLNRNNLKAPSKTVMFYEGESGVIRFRDNGFSVVCFADGHTEMVDTETAKTLVWKPE